MSTQAPLVPRSAAPSAARRPPAEAARPAPTPGRPTCGGRRTLSTLAATCPSRRASCSMSRKARAPTLRSWALAGLRDQGVDLADGDARLVRLDDTLHAELAESARHHLANRAGRVGARVPGDPQGRAGAWGVRPT